MISLPLLFAPFRALIGYRSDTHKSALGWRRVPYIWKGTMLQFGGFAIMPFALLVLSDFEQAVNAPDWIGYSSAALAFLLVGAGVHTVQTVGLALATDLVPVEEQPKVVGLMYVMLLVGMIAAALIFGYILTDYTPGKLVQVVQGAAVVTVALNLLALWKQEPRDRDRARTDGDGDPRRFHRRLAAFRARTHGGGPSGRDRAWHHGLRHGRCPAGALWRPGAGAFGRDDDAADGGLGAWRADRLRDRLTRFARRARPGGRGLVGHACGRSGLRRDHRLRSAGPLRRCSSRAPGLPVLARASSATAR
jgi:hypothetical protein